MPADHPSSFVRVASLQELQQRGVVVVTAADRPVAVFHHDGRAFAVDNRCPHLGFPLHKGTVKDGLVTCHWHEARFDLCSGCTFDLWADDVPAYDTRIEDGVVFVASRPRHAPDRDFYLRRLNHGLQHNISLIQAKAILGLRRLKTDWKDVLREIARFGVAHHDNWGEGMTLLAIAANLVASLDEQTAREVVFRAARQVADDCSDAVPRRERTPIEDGPHSPDRLGRWLCNWVRCRHRDAAERVLLTAAENLGPSPRLADLVFTAAAERVYAQIGHVFDATNKAFELLDAVGWDLADDVLPLVVQQTVMARGAEEDAHWHHPVEIIAPLQLAEQRLPALLQQGEDLRRSGKPAADWNEPPQLVPTLLGEDPLAVIELLLHELAAGAPPAELARRVAYAAALRLARFAMTNEVADWFNPRHTFIFANAVYQATRRSPTPGVVRGIFHAALSVYQDRFLNLPAARLPADELLHSLADDPRTLCAELLAALDRRADVDAAAALVARFLRLGHDQERLIDTLALATAREDLDFHAMQVLEAGARQARAWGRHERAEHVLIAVTRQLAAFCPTPRAAHQIATIAARLDRGEKMYEGDTPV